VTDVPRFGLVIVGDEILSGKRADKHMAKVIALLGERGLRLEWTLYLPDDRAAIATALQRTFAERDNVFVCGGIGSTPDDHTRQAAAAALGRPLELHPEAAALIEQRCREMASEGRGSADMSTPENRQRLTMGEFPAGSMIIPNPYNRIPGFAIERHWFLPGFPVMAWPMLEWVLETHFRSAFFRRPTAERSLLLYETPESAIAPLMQALERDFAGIKSFSLPLVGDGLDARPARRHIELGVKGDPAQVERAFEAMKVELARRGIEIDLPGGA
jgi:molybdopterin-biosynthesis enzyme MoeA-like protein